MVIVNAPNGQTVWISKPATTSNTLEPPDDNDDNDNDSLSSVRLLRHDDETDWRRTDWVVRYLGRRRRRRQQRVGLHWNESTFAAIAIIEPAAVWLRLLAVHAASAVWWETVVRGQIVYHWLERMTAEPNTALDVGIVLFVQACGCAAVMDHATGRDHRGGGDNDAPSLFQYHGSGHFWWALASAGWMLWNDGDVGPSLLARLVWQCHVSWTLWNNVNNQWDYVNDGMSSTMTTSSTSPAADTADTLRSSPRSCSPQSTTTRTTGWWPLLPSRMVSLSMPNGTARHAISPTGHLGTNHGTVTTTTATSPVTAANTTHRLWPAAETVTRRFFAAMDSQRCGSLTRNDVQRAVSYIQASQTSRPGVSSRAPPTRFTDLVQEQFDVRATTTTTLVTVHDTHTGTEPMPIHSSEPRLAYNDFVELLHALRPYL
jgi:hypothetical protein